MPTAHDRLCVSQGPDDATAFSSPCPRGVLFADSVNGSAGREPNAAIRFLIGANAEAILLRPFASTWPRRQADQTPVLCDPFIGC